MAQILTPHVYDDCEAIVEKYGCAVWVLPTDFFTEIADAGGSLHSITKEMLVSKYGLSETFFDNFMEIASGLKVLGVHNNANPYEVIYTPTCVERRFSGPSQADPAVLSDYVVFTAISNTPNTNRIEVKTLRACKNVPYSAQGVPSLSFEFKTSVLVSS